MTYLGWYLLYQSNATEMLLNIPIWSFREWGLGRKNKSGRYKQIKKSMFFNLLSPKEWAEIERKTLNAGVPNIKTLEKEEPATEMDSSAQKAEHRQKDELGVK